MATITIQNSIDVQVFISGYPLPIKTHTKLTLNDGQAIQKVKGMQYDPVAILKGITDGKGNLDWLESEALSVLQGFRLSNPTINSFVDIGYFDLNIVYTKDLRQEVVRNCRFSDFSKDFDNSSLAIRHNINFEFLSYNPLVNLI